MANTNDSFIDEVNEALRRDRLARWFRRWGWALVALALLIVAAAGWTEWRRAQVRAAAELRGEAILTAIDLPEAERLPALSELPATGEDGVVAAFLLASEQERTGDLAAASATLAGVAADGTVEPLWRDLAAIKSQLVLGAEADRATLEALAAPGQPYRLLAAEQVAMLDVAAGDDAAAIAGLQAILDDAEVGAGQSARVSALLTALGAPPEAPPAEADAAAPEAPAE